MPRLQQEILIALSVGPLTMLALGRGLSAAVRRDYGRELSELVAAGFIAGPDGPFFEYAITNAGRAFLAV